MRWARCSCCPITGCPIRPADEDAEIVVKSDDFLDKARTALQYYGMEGHDPGREQDENGVFDALYLLGLPPEGFVTTRRYSTGSQSQENDAHMLEWLASRCIAAFFRTGFRGAEQHHMDCYYYQLHTPSFCWQSFDREEDAVPAGLRLAAEGGGAVLRRVLPHAEKLRFAGRAARAPGSTTARPILPAVRQSEREKLEGASADAVYRFLNFYANWMIQIVRTLPPILCQPAEAEGRLPENELLDGERAGRAAGLLLTQYGLTHGGTQPR